MPANFSRPHFLLNLILSKLKVTHMELAGRRYAIPSWLSDHPLVVICLDGCDPSYLRFLSNGSQYHECPSKLSKPESDKSKSGRDNDNQSPAGDNVFVKSFDALLGLCAMPSFTNANNVSIVTGCAPHVHGVSGNHYFDIDLGKERPMNEASDIRRLAFRRGLDSSSSAHESSYAGTIFSALHDVSKGEVRVAAVTSKNKLFKLLQQGFSAEDAKSRFFSVEQLGVDMYSAEATLRLLSEGYKLVTNPDREKRPHVLYLSSTDYMQHKYAADEPEMVLFMQEIGQWVDRLRKEAGCVVCITADHGMSAKPDIVYLSDELVKRGYEKNRFRVVLPITDPYIAHHAALGSYCTVTLTSHNPSLSQEEERDRLAATIRSIHGVRLALPRSEASFALGIPNDATVGDIVVVMNEAFAVGKGLADHDLKPLKGMPLRSHGGLSEQLVPILIDKQLDLSEPIELIRRERGGQAVLRNFDVFFLALNATMKKEKSLNSSRL